MSAESITSRIHNDYVGGDASRGRIPGADKATSGHQYESVFPKETQGGVRRPQEHLPPSTGRDAPPAADVPPLGRTVRQTIPGDQLGNSADQSARSGIHRVQVARTVGDPVELPPAPDSRTVVDRDPYATPTSVGDTLTGATSQDVHSGLGHPGSGMSSAEAHHDGHSHRKRETRGAVQFGSGEVPREIGDHAETEQPGLPDKSSTIMGA